jgi:hypothetical protein
MSKEVITSSDIQVRYEQLYTFLMNFLWEFSTVQALANLEIAIFKRFPDKSEMLKCLNILKQSIIYTANELAEDDETEFKDAIDNLENAINDYDNAGYELYGVEIFIDNPDDILSADDIDISDNSKSKRKFNVGDIKHITKEERELQDEAMNTLSNPFETNEEGEE